MPGVWKVSDNSLTSLPHKLADTREVRCMVLYQDALYYGDDGVNIKIYSPATGTLAKLRNHETGEWGYILYTYDTL